MAQANPEELLKIVLTKGSHYISDALNNHSALINLVNTVLAIKDNRITELESKVTELTEKLEKLAS